MSKQEICRKYKIELETGSFRKTQINLRRDFA